MLQLNYFIPSIKVYSCALVKILISYSLLSLEYINSNGIKEIMYCFNKKFTQLRLDTIRGDAYMYIYIYTHTMISKRNKQCFSEKKIAQLLLIDTITF